jgi:hypothetical protein
VPENPLKVYNLQKKTRFRARHKMVHSNGNHSCPGVVGRKLPVSVAALID